MINFDDFEDMDCMPTKEKIIRSRNPISDRNPTQRLAEDRINRGLLRNLRGKD